MFTISNEELDILLKIKAVTTYKLELDEFQLYIIKLSEFFECVEDETIKIAPKF